MKTAIIISIIIALGAPAGFAQFCDPPGEVVGTTEYPAQTYGSSTQRIAVDNTESINIAWTKSVGGISPRHVFYNFGYEDSAWVWLAPGEGAQVSLTSGSGFASLALTSDRTAAIAYQNISDNYVNLAVDNFPGFGIFSYYDPPDLLPGGNHGLWPQVAISVNGDIHILMTEHMMSGDEYSILAYARSEDGGLTWINPVIVDSVASMVSTITASSDGKVAIVYLKPTDYSSYSIIKNDVCYFESADGRDWDFQNPVNITDYLNDNQDIFCPWGEDAAYDDHGYLHVTWVVNNIAMDGTFIDDATGLYYYNTNSNEIETITQFPDIDLACDPGPMNSAIAMPTISVLPNGSIVAVAFTGFTDSDASADNNCIGDLYCAVMQIHQYDWTLFNLTETHSPNCAGDCESEEFPSITENIDEFIYRTYLTYIMRNYGEDPDTVYFLPIDVTVLGLDDSGTTPNNFSLLRAYPNPFNAQTTIEFTMAAPGDVELTIYDITGAKVETISQQGLEAGRYSIVWDATDAASGVYFAKMEAGDFSQSIKMVLLK